MTLPQHLRELARVPGEVSVEAQELPTGGVTLGAALDALEKAYPGLKGTIRDHVTGKRRAFVRYFLCSEDWSFEPAEKMLPERILDGRDVFMVVGAIAGG